MLNTRQVLAAAVSCAAFAVMGACGTVAPAEDSVPTGQRSEWSDAGESTANTGTITAGVEQYRGFTLDNVLHSPNDGDIHFNMKLPEHYDSNQPAALFLTLPGYEGLYQFGVGANLRSEDFAFTAPDYRPNMIIVAPQLGDWSETSAHQTIALTEYLLDHYNIDRNAVFAQGYSGGGETMSRALGMRPELFTAFLHCSSQFDGDLDAVAKSRTPVRIVVGENDEYYGSQPSRDAYNKLHELYRGQGLSDEQIDEILMLDVRPASYFTSRGQSNEHAGGVPLFSHDREIMSWLFAQ